MVPLGKDGTQCGNMFPAWPPRTPYKEQILGMWCSSEAKCMPSDVHTPAIKKAPALVYSHMIVCRHICNAGGYNAVAPSFTRYICPQAASNAAAGKIIPHTVQMLSSLMLLMSERGFEARQSSVQDH